MKVTTYDKIYIPNKTKKLQNIKKWTKEEKSAKGPYIYDVHIEGWYERKNRYWKLWHVCRFYCFEITVLCKWWGCGRGQKIGYFLCPS